MLSKQLNSQSDRSFFTIVDLEGLLMGSALTILFLVFGIFDAAIHFVPLPLQGLNLYKIAKNSVRQCY